MELEEETYIGLLSSVEHDYQHNKAKGKLSCDKLLWHPELTSLDRTNIEMNRLHYDTPVIKNKLIKIILPDYSNYAKNRILYQGQPRATNIKNLAYSNISIISFGSGYLAAISLANQQYKLGKYWIISDEESSRNEFTSGEPARSINEFISDTILAKLDAAYNVISYCPLTPSTMRTSLLDPSYEGYHLYFDARLHLAGGVVSASYTDRLLDVTYFKMCCSPVDISKLPESGWSLNEAISNTVELPALKEPTSLLLQPGGKAFRTVECWEKNWTPYLIGDLPRWIYSFQPYIEAVIMRGAPVTCQFYQADLTFKGPELRGGSQAVPYKDGLLTVVHEHNWISGIRVYHHRLLWLRRSETILNDQRRSETISNSGIILMITPSFYLIKTSLEFVSGLVVINDNVILLSFGVDDCKSYIAEVNIDNIGAFRQV